MSRDRVRKLKPIAFPTLDGRAIGRRIGRARRGLKLRQVDLATLLGVRRLTVANWECGVRIPPRDTLVKLSIALRRTVDYLLLGRRDRKNAHDGVRVGTVRIRRSRPRPPLKVEDRVHRRSGEIRRTAPPARASC